MRRLCALWMLGCLGVLTAGCPREQDAAPAFQPSAPIPAQGALLSYAKLTLGMDSLALSQAYNAPEGRGEGFTRVITSYGDINQHFITFDATEGQPGRRIIAALFRDKLYWVVDRRDGLSAEQARAWLEECIAAYGEPLREPVQGAQWSWEQDGVQLTFTQDNASENAMSANVVLVHAPTKQAAHEYLAVWEAQHPQGEKPAADGG